MDADVDTLVTALYVKIDDMQVNDRLTGRPPRLSRSELVCLAVVQAHRLPRTAAAVPQWPRILDAG